MLFTSAGFIAFLCAVFILYYLIPKKFQWVLLLLGSYFFYACAGIHFLIYITVTSVTTWFAALKISDLHGVQDAYLAENKKDLSRDERKAYKASMKKKMRVWFVCCLLLNLGILAVIKYTDFAIENINLIFGTEWAFMDFALPMGISFYTFQSMGYLIDVYWGKYECQRNLPKFALFVSFFPQMVQGPISRYDQLSKTLYGEHPIDRKNISFGIQRILWGFFKKLVVADRLVTAVSALVAEPEEYKGVYVILVIFFYAIELYADFTGGIDITIGIAQVCGITMAENFDHPFLSKSTKEYWRRWHITMGTWFKDYIFYPVSVSSWMLKISKWSRKTFGAAIGKRVPVYLTTIILWFVTGFWHGASWNFIVWGLMNCLVIIVSQELEPLYAKFYKRFPKMADRKWWGAWQIFRTFWLMGTIRVLDCYRNVPLTFKQVGSVFTTFNWNVLFNGSLLDLGLSGADYIAIAIGVAVMVIVSLASRKESIREQLWKKPAALRNAVFLVLFFAVVIIGAYGVGYDSSQFIYNQF